MVIPTKETPLTCPWCEGGVPFDSTTCPTCFMTVNQSNNKKKGADKKLAPKDKSLANSPSSIEGMQDKITCLGIDPGARYTALSIRDTEGKVYLSSTYYRDDDTTEIEWVWECVDKIKEVKSKYPTTYIAVETTVDPKGFIDGSKNPLNPKDIIRTALVVGGIAQEWKETIILIRPRKNGSQEKEHYPKELVGRRPKNLEGFVDPKVKTRNHERSAYDVAGNALFEKR